MTATDPDGLRIDQSFVVNVVVEGGDSGGSGPFFPLPPQESGDSSDEGIDHANLLSETPVIVVPHSISLAPGESVILRTIAFNFLGDPLPASAVGVVCTWSSDGGGFIHAERDGSSLLDDVHGAGRGKRNDNRQGCTGKNRGHGNRHVRSCSGSGYGARSRGKKRFLKYRSLQES